MNAIVSKLALIADAHDEHTTVQSDAYDPAQDGELEIEVVAAEPDRAPAKVRHSVELLYTPSESIFAAAAPDMVDRGWSVFPQEISRKPGTVYGEMIAWDRKHQLKTTLPTPETMRIWRHHCSTLNVACVFGPASGSTFAIDIDVLDEAMSYQITDMADEMLGYTPLRREGRFPKIALIYRTAPDDEMTSSSRWISNADGGASEHGIEILGTGKPLTYHGRHHKTGSYFKWLDKNPQKVGPEAAPLVTTEQVADFMSAVDQAFGFAEVGSRRPTDPTGTWTADGSYVPNGEKANDGREATLTRLVSRIATSFKHDFWVAQDAGPDAVMDYRNAKLTEICTAFAAGNELTGRWAPHLLEGEARNRLDRWIAMISKGKRPPASKMQREKTEKPALEGWKAGLMISEKGAVRALLNNALIALEQAPEWQGVLAYNSFADRMILNTRPPYETGTGEWKARDVRDDDFVWTAQWLQQQDICVGADVTKGAMQAVSGRNAVHPVQVYLEGLEWDGVPRIDTWLIDHVGASDTPLHRKYGAKYLLSGVARIFQPGCQVDTVLILEGRQGLMKSTVFQVLAGQWFTDQCPDIGSKDASIQVQGIWILEFAELDKVMKADPAAMKAFITSRVDRYRRPHGVISEDHPRQGIFGGTVNPNGGGYLKDETGNRRLWPVACGVGWPAEQRIDQKSFKEVRDQLWAEAVVRYQSGEQWWLEADDEALQVESAGMRLSEDVWQTKIQEYVWSKPSVRMDDILFVGLSKDAGSWNQGDQMRVGRVMTAMGWTRKLFRAPGGKREWRYVPPVVLDAAETPAE